MSLRSCRAGLCCSAVDGREEAGGIISRADKLGTIGRERKLFVEVKRYANASRRPAGRVDFDTSGGEMGVTQWGSLLLRRVTLFFESEAGWRAQSPTPPLCQSSRIPICQQAWARRA